MRIARGAAASNTGRKRRHNEDAYVYEPPLFAVADGMGGAQAGELASSLAASTVHDLAAGLASAEPTVIELIQAANATVHQRAVTDAAAAGMGTTMTVALFHPDGNVVIGHVGDSRAYRLRRGELEQLTEDHSLVAELVRRGELSPEQAEVHPQRSVITRALGTEAEVDIDAFTVVGDDGDVFLLCSDGLTTMVDVPTIAAILQEYRLDLDAASRALIKAANDRGGEDNITAVLFALAADDDSPEPAPAFPPQPGRVDDEETLHPEDRVATPDLSFLTTVGELSLLPLEPDPHPYEREAPQRAGIGQLVLGQLVILVLAALIVFLVVKGFAQ